MKTERLNIRLTPYQKKQVARIMRLGPHATGSEAIWYAIQCYMWCLENKCWPGTPPRARRRRRSP